MVIKIIPSLEGIIFFVSFIYCVINYLEPYHLLERTRLIPDGVIAIEASGRVARLGMITLEMTE